MFVKCRVITGTPGSGKSFIMSYVALYALSKGLKVVMTSLMARRSVHLGGLHLQKLFLLPVYKSNNLDRVSELVLKSFLRNPVTLNILKMIDFIFLDEVGQISSEMMTCLDIILWRIRNNNIFLGGVLFICTMDHKQLQAINGKPFLVSRMVLSCFEFVKISESVRASQDSNLQHIQHHAHMNPRKYDENPELISEFKSLLSSTCTFVDSWNDPIISPMTYRLYGKKYPAQQSSKRYIDQVKCQLQTHKRRVKISEDYQTPQQSHQEWQVASECTSSTLDQRCKEPRELLFFKGALYQFTFNDDRNFTQSQLGLLIDLPNQNDTNNFRKIPIMVAPPGVKVSEFDVNKSKSEYIREGWVQKSVGMCPDRTRNVLNNMKGKRKQYGSKHHLTSTVHGSMGDTLHNIVTEISLENNEFRLWDKAQAIVLLSRKRLGSDIIFVGEE